MVKAACICSSNELIESTSCRCTLTYDSSHEEPGTDRPRDVMRPAAVPHGYRCTVHYIYMCKPITRHRQLVQAFTLINATRRPLDYELSELEPLRLEDPYEDEPEPELEPE